MTRFRALVLAGALALSFNFVGCFDHGGNPCVKEVAMAEGAGTTVPC